MIRTLAVELGDAHVGYLTHLVNDRTVFAFSPEYVENDARPVLSQSFLDDLGNLREEAQSARRLAPPFFSNLLPEGGLRTIIARYLRVSPNRDFPLLAYLGGDLIGAVRLSPTEPIESPAADALTFALPGVQLKLSALLGEADYLTIPAHGAGGDWIVKISSGQFPGLVENEFSMLALARMVGIEVPETRIIDASHVQGAPDAFDLNGKALAIRRFDRAGGARIHAEDFNQAFGQFPHEKYDNRTYSDVARLLNERAGFAQAREFVRRVVFSAAIGNGDMHLKNWSLLYPNGRDPILAPAYDYVTTLPFAGLDHDLGLSFGKSKSLDVLDERRLRAFAERAQLPYTMVRREALEMSERVREAWKQFDGPIIEQHRASLDAHICAFTNRSVRLKGPRLSETGMNLT
ncbi:MAG: type II toxin-antitoxin system HipA family toxin [Vulcanimicrobiaceae bacterium]